MDSASEKKESFAYRALTADDQAISGSIDAGNADHARQLLETLGLKNIDLTTTAPPTPARPLRSDEFQAFNQQLAHMAAANLPLERGLRLLATEMHSPRLATTVNSVAGEMESGVAIGDAFNRHRAQFPPLYAQLIDTGVRSGNLGGVLLNFSRHLDMVRRLRASLWRAMSYPLMVVISLGIVLTFLSLAVLPQFRTLYNDTPRRLGKSVWGAVPARNEGPPGLTSWVLTIGELVPFIVGAIVVLVAVTWLLLKWMNRRERTPAIVERIKLSIPIVGKAIRPALIARWCDMVRISIDSGQDLPAAIELAAGAIDSPLLTSDSEKLIALLSGGQTIGELDSGKILPPTVTMAIGLASRRNELSATLESLCRMYQQQSDLRIASLPAVLLPLLLIGNGLILGTIVLAMFVPLTQALRALMR